MYVVVYYCTDTECINETLNARCKPLTNNNNKSTTFLSYLRHIPKILPVSNDTNGVTQELCAERREFPLKSSTNESMCAPTKIAWGSTLLNLSSIKHLRKELFSLQGSSSRWGPFCPAWDTKYWDRWRYFEITDHKYIIAIDFKLWSFANRHVAHITATVGCN